MRESIKTNIRDIFNIIEKSTNTQKEFAIKNYLEKVLTLYTSGDISSSELGYNIAALVQFEDYITDKKLFLEMIKKSGILELPDIQVEKSGHTRDALVSDLIDLIRRFS